MRASYKHFQWLGASSSMMLSATVIRYMEPKTQTTYSESFESNEGDVTSIIYTGYHKWISQHDKSRVFLDDATKTFKPRFSYAVYRKKYTMDEALKLERDNLDLDVCDRITSNDFPFHYKRAKKRREQELKSIKDERWENASREERRIIYDELQLEKRRQRILKDKRYIFKTLNR